MNNDSFSPNPQGFNPQPMPENMGFTGSPQMVNGQLPNVQPQPAMPTPGQMPAGSQPAAQNPANPAKPAPSTPDATKPPLDIVGLVKTLVIIFLGLSTATFIGLFIWKQFEYEEARTDLDEKIAIAVADAKDEQAAELEAKFNEDYKYPYNLFAGPEDYGQVTLEYPKTWSAYVQKDASKGGDFEAYFNPGQVDAISKDSINALRLIVKNTSFDTIASQYQKDMEKKDADLRMQTVTFGKKDYSANRYDGKIPGTQLYGTIVIFKIRDKTAILQTDSTEAFAEDFEKILKTVTFNI